MSWLAFLTIGGQAAAGGSARDLTVSRSRIFAPKTHLPLNHPPAPQPGLSERRKIFFIRFVDCCHAKQLRGVGDCVSWVDNVTVDNRRHQGKFGSWPEFLQRLVVSLCCHGSTILRVHVAGNPVMTRLSFSSSFESSASIKGHRRW